MKVHRIKDILRGWFGEGGNIRRCAGRDRLHNRLSARLWTSSTLSPTARQMGRMRMPSSAGFSPRRTAMLDRFHFNLASFLSDHRS